MAYLFSDSDIASGTDRIKMKKLLLYELILQAANAYGLRLNKIDSHI